MAVTDEIAKPSWLSPPLVLGPDPKDPTKQATFKISDHYIDCLFSIGRLSPIFQLWAHVVGELPPINNIAYLHKGPISPSLTTLMQCVACFQGVNRAYDDEKDGHSVLVYVLNPKVTIVKDANMVCMAKSVQLPAGTALTVQVKPVSLQAGEQALHTGVVTRLEHVGAEGEPALPRAFGARYAQRLW